MDTQNIGTQIEYSILLSSEKIANHSKVLIAKHLSNTISNQNTFGRHNNAHPLVLIDKYTSRLIP